MTCANPTVDFVVTLPRCRCCGRNHEQVLVAAERMRRVAGVERLAGWELRTRFRKVVAGAIDLVCWFCQLEADRYVWSVRDAGGPAALRAAVLYRMRATARLAETWAGF